MYMLDPERGRRRRALARDRGTRLWHDAEFAAGKVSRDMENRVRGLRYEARSRMEEERVSGDVLAARVRARLGHLVSHPSAIEVAAAEDGSVTLTGAVLSREARNLISGVAGVRGVTRVEDRLERHDSPDKVPGLQGGPDLRRSSDIDILQANWSPATRFLVGASGSLLTLIGLIRGGFRGMAISALGAGMITRSVTNREIRDLLSEAQGACSQERNSRPVEEVSEFR